MPSPKYTKIEITPEAYLALEAEAIIRSKTLKKLASELILNGVSEESLNFAERASTLSETETDITHIPHVSLSRHSIFHILVQTTL